MMKTEVFKGGTAKPKLIETREQPDPVLPPEAQEAEDTAAEIKALKARLTALENNSARLR